MNLLDDPLFGLVGLAIPLVGLLVVAVVAYLVIRLGVRHALLDVDRRRRAAGDGPAGGGARG